jgi:hypothetical protein
MFVPGQLYRRRDLHNQFGGQRQGGISTPANAPFVILITGDSGNKYGYVDEWTNNGFFSYTGEGQKGPMRFVSGNKAIRDHKTSENLFISSSKTRRINASCSISARWNTRTTKSGLRPTRTISNDVGCVKSFFKQTASLRSYERMIS